MPGVRGSRRHTGVVVGRRVVSAWVTALLVILGPALGMLRALATEIPDAVTNVQIVESGSTLYGSMHLSLDWTVPDGTKAGDTFTIGLPPQIEAPDGFRFPIKDAAGKVVAWGEVQGGKVVFTMTKFAETHDGVSGTAWLEV